MIYGLTMKPRPKKAWVDALRSGKFLQGKHALKTEDEHYCCLGVKAKIKRVPTTYTIRSGTEFMFPKYGHYATSLPVEWFSKYFNYDKAAAGNRTKEDGVRAVQDTLMRMNDNNKTFEEIAHWIDENL